MAEIPRARTKRPVLVLVELLKSVSEGSRQRIRKSRTMACKPALVTMYRWCTRPYSSSAEDSMIETSGMVNELSSAQDMRC